MCASESAGMTENGLELSAWVLYEQTKRQLHLVNPVPLDTVSEDGSQQMALPGVISLPSATETKDIGLLISWALEFLISSGSLPSRDQLCTFAQSLAVGPVGSIITPLSLVHIASWFILIASGDESVALPIVEDMIQAAGQPTTSPNTLRKIMPALESGTSMTESSSLMDLAIPAAKRLAEVGRRIKTGGGKKLSKKRKSVKASGTRSKGKKAKSS